MTVFFFFMHTFQNKIVDWEKNNTMRLGFLLLCLMAFHVAKAQPSKDFEMEILLQCNAVEDQQASGTCWSFASNSFLESEMLRMRKDNINLSEMYQAYYSYLLKLEQYLSTQGKSFFTAGGQFHDVIKVLKRFGAVAQKDYSGQAIFQGHYHPPLDSLMHTYAQYLLAQGKKNLSQEDEKMAVRILNTFLGAPPQQVQHQGKSYTPQNYLREVLGINPDDYIEITSVANQPFYSTFVLDDKYNWTKDLYHNVPLDDFVTITNEALKKGFSVLWDGDSVEPTFLAEQGKAFLADSVQVNQMTRQKALDNKSTQIEHVMHIVGIAKEKNNLQNSKNRSKKNDKVKHWYYVKNSWGEISEFKGFLYMNENYFKMKTVAIVVHKEAIPSAIRKKMKL
jgi:bleomycin hydrolase